MSNKDKIFKTIRVDKLVAEYFFEISVIDWNFERKIKFNKNHPNNKSPKEKKFQLKQLINTIKRFIIK